MNPTLDRLQSCATRSDSVVADLPERAKIRTGKGQPCGVLFLANPTNPDLVGRAVRNAKAACEMLGEQLGMVVLQPLADGVFEGLSYVLWPWVRPVSNSRYVALIQRRILRSKVLAWLRKATDRTKLRDANTKGHFVNALTNLASIGDLPDEMTREAARGLERLQAGEWRPYQVLEHNDLWFGNIMLPPSRRDRTGCPFYIIDWAGARTRGFPIFDLIRLSLTTGVSGRALNREIQRHCTILGCLPIDAIHYLLAALGYLEQTLEYFPRERYNETAQACYKTIRGSS